MSERVLAAATGLRDVLAGFDPSVLSGEECAVVVEALAATGKACDAARVAAAARAADCGAHRRRGFVDPVGWLAQETGTSSGAARDALEVARAVQDCPATKVAFASGGLSMAQAGEIARTEAVCPGSETELVTLAATSSLAALKDRARKTRMAGVDAEDLLARQHRARRLRHWRNELGMICVSGELRPDVGLPFVNRLDAETDRLGRAARAAGHPEPRDSRAADAFAAMISGAAGSARVTKIDMVVVCDLNAWRRGHTHPAEACRIVGGDLIPVWLARQLGADAFLKAVLHDGVDIHTVAHFGRHIPAQLRTALELGAPPDFDGAVCSEPGCGRRHGLEWDHVDPVAHGGPTSFTNIEPRCWPDHQAKTERDRQAGLHRPPVTQRDPKPP